MHGQIRHQAAIEIPNQQDENIPQSEDGDIPPLVDVIGGGIPREVREAFWSDVISLDEASSVGDVDIVVRRG